MNFNSPPSTPVQAMQAWFDEAVELQSTPNPLAMALSTVNAEGRPSSRMVLLKGFDASGAVLYTNYKSAKANEIAANSMVSLLFHCDTMQRQIHIQGSAIKISAQESDEYFATRDSLSQAGAWASEQSKPLEHRTDLIKKVESVQQKWSGKIIPRPEFWGGYRVSLDTVELWQGHDGRLHDRIRYTCADGQWSWERLQP